MRLVFFIYCTLLWLEPVFHVKAPFSILGEFDLSYNLGALIILNILFYFKYFAGQKPVINKLYFVFIAVLLLSVISTLFSNPTSFLSAGSLLFQFLLQSTLLLYIGTISVQKKLRHIIFFFWVFAYINCIFVYISYFFPDSLEGVAEIHGYFGYNKNDRPDYIRAFGILGDVAPWLLSFFAILSLQRKKYLSFAFFAGSGLMGGSIGASILLVVAFYLALTLNQRNKKTVHYKVIGSILAVLFLAMLIRPSLVLNNPVANRVLAPETFKQHSGAQRLFTYGLAISYIAQNPITGYGYGTFLYNLKNAFDYKLSFLKFQDGAISNANNQILQTWFETGLIGLLILMVLALKVLKKIKRGLVFGLRQAYPFEIKKAILIWLSCFLLLNQTAVYLIPSLMWVFICCIIGICFAIDKITKVENTARTEITGHSRV